MAKILEMTEESINLCVEKINAGALVSFPTETVYGIGASIYCHLAIEKIFAAKKRPKTDPLIVHVADFSHALELLILNVFQKKIYDLLTNHFWPGPLTLVLPRNPNKICDLITAGGDYVGVRSPNHTEAQIFLNAVQVPIAAPSANLFNHVSPTSAEHVFTDLGDVDDLFILKSNIGCDFGIESTVLKIMSDGKLIILRLGAIGSIELNCYLKQFNVSFELVVKQKNTIQNDLQRMESPGQGLKHYSPSVETYIYLENKDLNQKSVRFTEEQLKQTVFIDFFGKNIHMKSKFLCYLNLSDKLDINEVSKNLFMFLRKAEQIEKANYIIICESSNLENSLSLAINDRIYRAASGKHAVFS